MIQLRKWLREMYDPVKKVAMRNYDPIKNVAMRNV